MSRFFVAPCLAFFLQRGLFHLGKNTGGLFAPHYRDAGVGPHEHEARIIGAATHAVVTGAETAAGDYGEFRHGGTGHRVDHLGTVFGDAFGFVFLADHETGDVLQEQQGDLALVAQLDEVRAFLGGFRVQHTVVSENAHRVAVDAGKAAHQGGAVTGFEFVQFRAVDHACNQLTGRHGLAGGGGDDTVQLLRVVGRGLHGQALYLIRFVPVQVGDALARQLEGMGFVFGQVIRHTGLFTVQVGTPQIFGSDHLAGGRFYQWWAGQEDGGLFFHHDHFVGHGGHISAAGGAGTEHYTDLRNATGGHVGHVEKDAPEVFAVREYLVLAG